jgi:hypothetical protein
MPWLGFRAPECGGGGESFARKKGEERRPSIASCLARSSKQPNN